MIQPLHYWENDCHSYSLSSLMKLLFFSSTEDLHRGGADHLFLHRCGTKSLPNVSDIIWASWMKAQATQRSYLDSGKKGITETHNTFVSYWIALINALVSDGCQFLVFYTITCSTIPAQCMAQFSQKELWICFWWLDSICTITSFEEYIIENL